MKVAIMQPYFLPYIGYFQLANAVDAFVIYDDVNFIKGGWINRNTILAQGKSNRITLQLQGASPNLLINQISVGSNKNKLLKSIQQSYSKAPQYDSVYPLIEEIVMHEESNLAKYLDYGLRQICGFLSITPKWYISSELQKNSSLRGQDKVIAICKELNATHYINPPGGKHLYDFELFSQHGIKLSFIGTQAVPYNQYGSEFVSHLSIIDVMMFNDTSQCSHLLRKYKLVHQPVQSVG